MIQKKKKKKKKRLLPHNKLDLFKWNFFYSLNTGGKGGRGRRSRKGNRLEEEETSLLILAGVHHSPNKTIAPSGPPTHTPPSYKAPAPTCLKFLGVSFSPMFVPIERKDKEEREEMEEKEGKEEKVWREGWMVSLWERTREWK